MKEEKWLRRDEKKRKNRKMGVDGRSIFTIVGHPATKQLLESLGAVTIPGRWKGPEVGEEYLAVPLNQNAREGGYTKDVAIESARDLRAVLCKRIA